MKKSRILFFLRRRFRQDSSGGGTSGQEGPPLGLHEAGNALRFCPPFSKSLPATALQPPGRKTGACSDRKAKRTAPDIHSINRWFSHAYNPEQFRLARSVPAFLSAHGRNRFGTRTERRVAGHGKEGWHGRSVHGPTTDIQLCGESLGPGFRLFALFSILPPEENLTPACRPQAAAPSCRDGRKKTTGRSMQSSRSPCGHDENCANTGFMSYSQTHTTRKRRTIGLSPASSAPSKPKKPGCDTAAPSRIHFI